MPDVLSPLRYPGSKYVLTEYFESIIGENLLTGCHFYEPYVGGASLSLALLSRGAISRATWVERDPLVYAFWKAALTQTDELCDRIKRVKVTVPTWQRFQKYLDPDALKKFTVVELGLAGLFLNRANFSGMLAAKPIGGMSQSSRYTIDCRFNKERIIGGIQQIAQLAPSISVRHGDAVTFMRRNAQKIAREHALVYVDPPYLQQGKRLYRYAYEEQHHRRLAQFMDAAPFRWVVSYDNHEFIRSLFSKQKIVPIFLNYAVKQSRKAEELLISNVPLPKLVYRDSDGRCFTAAQDDVLVPLKAAAR